jgi:tRNA(Ile)-lysidine synthase TilS/MesJ
MIKVIPQYVPKEPFYFLVSGGVDCIAAAHWMVHRYHKKIRVVHFNHNVQDINDTMSRSVWNFVTDNYDNMAGGYFKSREESMEPAFNDISENGLREWRLYKMKGIGGKFVTAHHLNDACENYLDNCFKGCPEHKPIKEFTQFDGFSIYHPFLKTTKQDFIDYAEENDLMKYVVVDPTNTYTRYKRNWIRNSIIPQINERQLGLEKVVLKKFYNNLKESD